MYTTVASSYARCRAVRVGVGWCWGPARLRLLCSSSLRIRAVPVVGSHGCCLLPPRVTRRSIGEVEKNEQAAKRGAECATLERNEMLPEITKTDVTGAVQYGLSI